MVKLVANMHGNEVVGREMLLKLAGLLLTRSHPAAERILDSIDLHILVSLNPDGFEKIKSAGAGVDCSQYRQNVTGGHGRFNANNVRVQHKYVDRYYRVDQKKGDLKNSHNSSEIHQKGKKLVCFLQDWHPTFQNWWRNGQEN